MKIKQGVSLTSLQPQMVIALLAVYDAYRQYDTEVVITSGNDGRHSMTSFHYSGNALDFRTRNLPNPEADGVKIAARLKDALGEDFDVLFEGTHIHIEHQPRRKD